MRLERELLQFSSHATTFTHTD
jgi:hypothetical protein